MPERAKTDVIVFGTFFVIARFAKLFLTHN